MNSSKDPWKRLIDASKSSPEEPEPKPPRISVKNLRTTVHQLVLTLTWRKWSLLAAITAGLIFLFVLFNLHDDAPPQGPIILPEPPVFPTAL